MTSLNTYWYIPTSINRLHHNGNIPSVPRKMVILFKNAQTIRVIFFSWKHPTQNVQPVGFTICDVTNNLYFTVSVWFGGLSTWRVPRVDENATSPDSEANVFALWGLRALGYAVELGNVVSEHIIDSGPDETSEFDSVVRTIFRQIRYRTYV